MTFTSFDLWWTTIGNHRTRWLPQNMWPQHCLTDSGQPNGFLTQKMLESNQKQWCPSQKKTISFYRSKISLSLQFIWRKNSFNTQKTGNVDIKVETVLICKIWHSHGNIHFWTWMGGFCVISHNRKLLEYWGKKIGSNNQNFNATLSCYSFIPLILLVVEVKQSIS